MESDPCKTMSCVLNEETQEISIQQTIQLCNITCGIVSYFEVGFEEYQREKCNFCIL